MVDDWCILLHTHRMPGKSCLERHSVCWLRSADVSVLAAYAALQQSSRVVLARNQSDDSQDFCKQLGTC